MATKRIEALMNSGIEFARAWDLVFGRGDYIRLLYGGSLVEALAVEVGIDEARRFFWRNWREEAVA